MQNGFGYFETSALNGSNIEAAFLTLINCKSSLLFLSYTRRILIFVILNLCVYQKYIKYKFKENQIVPQMQMELTTVAEVIHVRARLVCKTKRDRNRKRAVVNADQRNVININIKYSTRLVFVVIHYGNCF